MFRTTVALVALAWASDAVAQTSNCMKMGDNMVHCDSMGPNGSTSSTNCIETGGGTANCNTMPMGQPQTSYPTPDMSRPKTDGSTLNFIGGLIAQSRERSFENKIRQMLSSGDCLGASTLAHSYGREGMSDEILRSCQPKAAAQAPDTITAEQFMAGTPVPPAPTFDPSKPFTERAAPHDATESAELTSRLTLAVSKANAATPLVLDETTTISKAEVIGSQILLTASVNATGLTISGPLRVKVQNELCADQSIPALLTAGASVRIKYFEPSGKEIGSVMVTRTECGL